MAYIRKYQTGSGATGVQVCYKAQGRVVKTVQIGSAKSEGGVEKLVKKAREVMMGGNLTLFDLKKYDKKVGTENREEKVGA